MYRSIYWIMVPCVPQLDIVMHVCLMQSPLVSDDEIQLRRPSFSILPKLSVTGVHLIKYHINFLNPP